MNKMFIHCEIRGHLIILFIILSSILNKSIQTERQFLLSNIPINKIHQNPYYFYNLNPSFNNPAFKLGIQTESPSYSLNNNKPIFSLHMKPEHEIKQSIINHPKLFYSLQSNDPSIQMDFNSFLTENLVQTTQFNVDKLNAKQLNRIKNRKKHNTFHNKIGLLNEQNDDHPMNSFSLEQSHQTGQIGHWCNSQMQQVLQPYCFCGKSQVTKNTIICSNLPNEIALRRTLNAASVILNVEDIYRISKLRIFNSKINDLNSHTLPHTLTFMLIQMNKCELRTFDKLNIFQNSVHQLNKIDLSNNEIEEFPFNELYQLNALVILKLSYNHLKSIPDEALHGCHKLRMLDLSFNQLNYLGGNAFTGALNLKYLDLSYNQLKVLNNNALAFQPSTIVHFINLSNNQMLFISESAFDNLIAHKIYLNNNRLRRFQQKIFEPLINNMVKINIEQKLLLTDNMMNRNQINELNNGNQMNYRNKKLNNSIGNLGHYKTLEQVDQINNQINQNYINKIYKKISIPHSLGNNSLNDSLNGFSQSSDTSDKFNSINSSKNLFDDFNEKLNVLINSNLINDSLIASLIDDLIFDKFLNEFKKSDQLNKRTNVNLRSFNSFDNELNSIDNSSDNYMNTQLHSQLLSFESYLNSQLPFSQSIDSSSNKLKDNLLDTSNSFREEINTNQSLIYFDDEKDYKKEFLNQKPSQAIQSTNFEFNNDIAFIQVSDNDFQCNCEGFEWLFKLNLNQLKILKEFQCSNLDGQKKFLPINQLTTSDINCWNSD